ncbi:hypothetical protein FISHEDRAFT_10678, partial [Fistulina hepatica ATCC 64428]
QPLFYIPPILSRLPEHTTHADQHKAAPTTSELQPASTTERLPDIDSVSRALRKALHHFRPITSAYASVAYSDAFNWGELDLWPADDDDGTPSWIHAEYNWYCVAFRSIRRKGSDSERLYEADREAHEEAVRNGGLLLYWYGVPDETGLNLGTCIWQSRAQALAALSQPLHAQAARLARDSYEIYQLERYILKKEAGSTRVHILPF